MTNKSKIGIIQQISQLLWLTGVVAFGCLFVYFITFTSDQYSLFAGLFFFVPLGTGIFLGYRNRLVCTHPSVQHRITITTVLTPLLVLYFELNFLLLLQSHNKIFTLLLFLGISLYGLRSLYIGKLFLPIRFAPYKMNLSENRLQYFAGVGSLILYPIVAVMWLSKNWY